MISFFERLQKLAPISTWALFGAGPAISVMLAGMVTVLWLGGWSAASDHQRLEYLGAISFMLALDLAVVIASLAKAKVQAHGPGGVSFDISSDDDANKTTATATLEVKK